MKKIIFIIGPTASGKTSLSIDIAKKYNGEIVSSDSMQIYKGLNIGTAKPTISQMKGVKHYLLDFIEPSGEYNVAIYQNDARAVIKKIFSNGKIPIVVGGTGLYVNAILYNMRFSDCSKNAKIRAKLEQNYNEIGGEKMLEQLKVLCQSSSRANENFLLTLDKIKSLDKKRVIRVWETFILGKNPDYDEFNTNSYYEDKNILIFFLNPDREKLYKNINIRVDKMIEEGLIEEIRGLLKNGITFESQGMKSIGYKEFEDYFKNNLSLEETINLIKQKTRNYAKRQITWFKRYKNAIQLDSYDENIKEKMCNIIDNFLRCNLEDLNE